MEDPNNGWWIDWVWFIIVMAVLACLLVAGLSPAS